MTRADLANAQWNLDQTAVYAPTSGYAINVQLRPGSYVTAFPVAPAMSFVEETYQVIALYAQNELPLVEPGNPAEFTLKTYPGRVIKAKVDSIVWAQGQGQVAQSGMLPQTGAYPQVPGRFPVKFDVAERDRASVPRRRQRRPRRDLHRARARDPHPAHGDPARRHDHRLPRAEAALMRASPICPADARWRPSRPRWRAARWRLRRPRRNCRRRC